MAIGAMVGGAFGVFWPAFVVAGVTFFGVFLAFNVLHREEIRRIYPSYIGVPAVMGGSLAGVALNIYILSYTLPNLFFAVPLGAMATMLVDGL